MASIDSSETTASSFRNWGRFGFILHLNIVVLALYLRQSFGDWCWRSVVSVAASAVRDRPIIMDPVLAKSSGSRYVPRLDCSICIGYVLLMVYVLIPLLLIPILFISGAHITPKTCKLNAHVVGPLSSGLLMITDKIIFGVTGKQFPCARDFVDWAEP